MMTEHGRLIDADALIAKYGNWYTEEGTEEGSERLGRSGEGKSTH